MCTHDYPFDQILAALGRRGRRADRVRSRKRRTEGGERGHLWSHWGRPRSGEVLQNRLLLAFAPWECDGKSVSSMPRSNFESAR